MVAVGVDREMRDRVIAGTQPERDSDKGHQSREAAAGADDGGNELG